MELNLERNLKRVMLYGFSYGIASEETDWLRLLLFENKVGNITKKQLHECILTKLACFYPTPAKLGSVRPNTDCLAALNGICTKRNTARFELLLFENEVKNKSQT